MDVALAVLVLLIGTPLWTAMLIWRVVICLWDWWLDVRIDVGTKSCCNGLLPEMEFNEYEVEAGSYLVYTVSTLPPRNRCSPGEMCGAVVFLHGFPETCYSWRHQLFSTPGARIAIQMPGYRPTRRADGRCEVFSDFYPDRIAQVVWRAIEAFPVDAVILCGHDWGAMIAWTMALQQASSSAPMTVRISQLISLGLPHPLAMLQALRPINLVSDFEQWIRSAYIVAFTGPFVSWVLSWRKLSIVYWWISGWKSTSLKRSHLTYEDWYHSCGKYLADDGSLHRALQYYRAMVMQAIMQSSVWHCPSDSIITTLKNRGPPTIMVCGRNDPLFSRKVMEFSESLVNQFILLPNCSHWVQQDAPRFVATIINDAIDSIPMQTSVSAS